MTGQTVVTRRRAQPDKHADQPHFTPNQPLLHPLLPTCLVLPSSLSPAWPPWVCTGGGVFLSITTPLPAHDCVLLIHSLISDKVQADLPGIGAWSVSIAQQLV